MCRPEDHRTDWRASFDGALLELLETAPFAALLRILTEEASRRGLVTGTGHRLHFVAQSDLPVGVPYEAWIASTGGVPTRDNAHDRYNALMWLHCPLTKAALNRAQAQALTQQTDPSRRGPVRDAATLWDENLLVLVASTPAQAERCRMALCTHDWSGLFMRDRSTWFNGWHPRAFGHALIEKLCRPYKAITAHGLIITAERADWPWLDPLLARRVDMGLTPRPFLPIPVMGIPGWDVANGHPAFYDDPRVFRLARDRPPV